MAAPGKAAAAAAASASPTASPTVARVAASGASSPVAGSATDAAAAKAAAKARRLRVMFQPVGAAPLMKKNKFKIDMGEPFAVVVRFLRRMLHMGEADSLFVYCNHTFCPNPNEIVGDLHSCFAVNGELVLNYSVTNAWG